MVQIVVVSKGIGLLVVLLVFSISITTAFALTELERATLKDPRLVNAFGVPIGNNVNVDRQIQITADITNNQEISQKFAYLVQIKDKNNFVVKLVWFSGELNPHQEWSPSVSWVPKKSGEFIAEIFVWEGFPVNHKALSDYTTLQINVS